MDVMDEAAARFYTPYGFITVPEHPQRLDRRIKDIKVSLDQAADPRM